MKTLRAIISLLTIIALLQLFSCTKNSGSGTAKLDSLGTHVLSIGGPTKALSLGDYVFFVERNPFLQQSAIDVYNVSTGAWTIGQLGIQRVSMGVAAAGNKVVFAGGSSGSNNVSNEVDILNVSTNTWTTAQLSEARQGPAATAAGNFIFIAGGVDSSGYSDVVDIYNVQTNQWTTSHLSEKKWSIAAAAAGDYVFFAGGLNEPTADNPAGVSAVVDIYNISTHKWSTSKLSQARGVITAAGGGSVVVFAGGFYSVGASDFYVPTVDVYNVYTNQWSTTQLDQPLAFAATTASNGLFFICGGANSQYTSNTISIYNPIRNSWSTALMSTQRFAPGAAAAKGYVFVAGGETNTGMGLGSVDIYKIGN